MPASESNKTTPSRRILPRSGCSSPAMHYKVKLFPQPEAPRSPVMGSSVSKSVFRRKFPSRFSIVTLSNRRSFLFLSAFLLQAVYSQQHGCRDSQVDENP